MVPFQPRLATEDLQPFFGLDPLATYRGGPEVTRHGKCRPQRYAIHQDRRRTARGLEPQANPASKGFSRNLEPWLLRVMEDHHQLRWLYPPKWTWRSLRH